MRSATGIVGPDGRSIVPADIYDMVAGADEVSIDAEIQKKLDAMFNSDLSGLKARFKIEVAFTTKRSALNAFPGVITAWTNGGYAHGGGDEAIYFCTAVVDRGGVSKICSAPVDLKFVGRDVALCPTCRNAVKPGDLAGQVFARLPMQHWAGLITRVFRVLECNADIRMGIMHEDLRVSTAKEMESKTSGGEKLGRARGRREWVIYPLRNIIKDTGAGADLQTRIRAFLQA